MGETPQSTSSSSIQDAATCIILSFLEVAECFIVHVDHIFMILLSVIWWPVTNRKVSSIVLFGVNSIWKLNQPEGIEASVTKDPSQELGKSQRCRIADQVQRGFLRGEVAGPLGRDTPSLEKGHIYIYSYTHLYESYFNKDRKTIIKLILSFITLIG